MAVTPSYYDFNLAPMQRQEGEARADFIDQEVASRLLAERAADWVRILFPNGRLDDDRHWRVANIHGDRPKKSGSCVIYLHGDYAGGWHDHDGGDGGGPLSTIARRLGLSGAELFAKVRELVGVFHHGMPEGKRSARPKADHSTDIAHIKRHSTPIAGTLAQTYLEARGIKRTIDSPDLRFGENVSHWERKTGEPCLVAQLRYPNGVEAGLERIYLRHDGSWHAGKKMLGPCDGALCMLSPFAARMGIGEGIESTAAAMQLFDLPACAACSADNLKKFGDFIRQHGPNIIRELVIFSDRGKAGQDAALYLARCAGLAGIAATIALPIGDDDFADDLLHGRGRSDITLPIDEPLPEPEPEIIEPSSYADVQAAIAKVAKSDYTTAANAIELLSRCADTDPMKDEDALNRIKGASGYGIVSLRTALTQQRARNLPQVADGEPVISKPWKPFLVYRDAEQLRPTGGMHNVGAVLKYGEQFQRGDKSIFWFNEFSLNVVTYGPLPWDSKVYLDTDFPRNLEHRDILGVVDFCQGYDIPTDKGAAGDALLALASLQTFHPVRDFFDECHKEWLIDRKPRLDALLTRYCGVVDTELARACGARWMIGSVARIYDPGCQMDTALILEGDQGIRKSSFFRVLAQDRPWFVDQLSDMGGKDSLIETAGALVIELAELDAMRRADVSRIKKYLAFRSDRFRPPWERLVVDVARQCIFAGTINPDGNPYLNDMTGGRRFWCFASPAIDIEAVKRDVRLLWGEAVERYRKGERWWLHEDHLVAAAAKEVSARTDYRINEAWEPEIIKWLAGTAAAAPFTVEDVLRGALGFTDRVLHTKAAQMDVAAILRVNGYKRNDSIRPRKWSKPQPTPQPLWRQPAEREPGEEG